MCNLCPHINNNQALNCLSSRITTPIYFLISCLHENIPGAKPEQLTTLQDLLVELQNEKIVEKRELNDLIERVQVEMGKCAVDRERDREWEEDWDSDDRSKGSGGSIGPSESVSWRVRGGAGSVSTIIRSGEGSEDQRPLLGKEQAEDELETSSEEEFEPSASTIEFSARRVRAWMRYCDKAASNSDESEIEESLVSTMGSKKRQRRPPLNVWTWNRQRTTHSKQPSMQEDSSMFKRLRSKSLAITTSVNPNGKGGDATSHQAHYRGRSPSKMSKETTEEKHKKMRKIKKKTSFLEKCFSSFRIPKPQKERRRKQTPQSDNLNLKEEHQRFHEFKRKNVDGNPAASSRGQGLPMEGYQVCGLSYRPGDSVLSTLNEEREHYPAKSWQPYSGSDEIEISSSSSSSGRDSPLNMGSFIGRASLKHDFSRTRRAPQVTSPRRAPKGDDSMTEVGVASEGKLLGTSRADTKSQVSTAPKPLSPSEHVSRLQEVSPTNENRYSQEARSRRQVEKSPSSGSAKEPIEEDTILSKSPQANSSGTREEDDSPSARLRARRRAHAGAQAKRIPLEERYRHDQREKFWRKDESERQGSSMVSYGVGF